MKDTKPIFDMSRTGQQVSSQRYDQPGAENLGADPEDRLFSHNGKTVSGDFAREDRGWREGDELPTAEAQLREPDDPGKTYTPAEIQALYPNGYAPGAPSIHNPTGPHYRFPEARPKRIYG